MASSSHRVAQRHAGLARLEDEMVERQARQPGDHLRRDVGGRAEEPAVLHESLGHVKGIVAGERLALAGRRIDAGLARAFGRVLHAIDMVEIGLVPLDRVGGRIAHEDLAHQRMRQAAGILARGLVVEGFDLAHQMPEFDQRRHQEAGAMAHGTRARLGCGRADPQRQADRA